MQIEKLEIKGFGKFEDTSFSLGKGINIIYGFNESGKSTLQWFIRSMLYGLKGGRASKDGIPPPVKRFKPWTGGQYGGSMEYRLDDGTFIRVERNFDNNSVVVYDESFNNITNSFDYSKDKGVLFAEKHLGINDTCFERTVLVRQMETRLDGEGRSELLGRITNTSQTGFEDISLKKAEASLRDALKNFVGTEKTRTSPVDKLNERLGALKALRVDAAERRVYLLDKEAALRRAVSEKAVACRTYDYIKKIRGLIDLRLHLENEKSKESSLQEILGAVTNAEFAVSTAVSEYESLKSGLGRGCPRDNRPRDNGNNNNGAKIAAIILFLCSVAFGTFGMMIKQVFFIPSGVLLILSMLLFISGVHQRQEHGDNTEDDLELARLMEFKLQEIIKLKDTLKNLCEEASAVLGKPAGSAAQVRELLSEASAAAGSIDIKLKAVIKEIINTYPGIEAGLFDCRRLHSIINDSSVKWLEETWQYENGKLEDRVNEMSLKIREYETVLKSDNNEFDDLQAIDEEIAELELRKSKLEDTGNSLKMALEVLAEAAGEIQKGYAPDLNTRMSNIIYKITGGRYVELKADDDFSLLTISPDTGSVTQVPVLSGATIDQMYLALRLATAELAFQGEQLPIILDEAFSQYDDNRTLETLNFIKDCYSEGQVLIFTSKGREIELAETAFRGNINLVRI